MNMIKAHPLLSFCSLLMFLNLFSCTKQGTDSARIDLSGEWNFEIDSLDEGIDQKWFDRKLGDKIKLPGSMTTNGKGYDIDIHTPWTGSIFDSAWFKDSKYEKYRQSGNVKVPFWLQPLKYYKGAAWYQKTIDVASSWEKNDIELFIERSHWETTLWVDGTKVGMQNSLGTPHVFNLSQQLTPGEHQITIRIDNRVKEFNPGQNSHSISDHTQSNWNGMVGELSIRSRPSFHIDSVKLFPDVKNKKLLVRMNIGNSSATDGTVTLQLTATSLSPDAEKLAPVTQSIDVKSENQRVELAYPMGNNPLLWDEFHPNLYSLDIKLTTTDGKSDERKINFGMRDFDIKGTQFTINDRPTLLRGTLECAIFPKTGYPATDEKEWTRIFKICRSYGLNHMRFHSWTPPEAAFNVADSMGFYLQVECSSWANQGSTIGEGKPLDRYIYDESNRVVNAFGNHPSFCMMAYGNEPSGNDVAYLTEFVNYWKAKDPRRLYTTAAGWPVIPENDFNNTPAPRIQSWGDGLKSIINSQPPRADYDWRTIIAKLDQPTVSHEIGQWCVYPDFKEIEKYDGVLKAKNFEIFKDQLKVNGMENLADSFLLASGKLQALCYKADIEAALRTPGFGGFQLLDLHDFPGQGTALVGVLNPFWESKGYISGEEYSAFCNSTVPLARLPKMTYLNSENLVVPVEISHFGESALNDVTPTWNIKDASGKIIFEGKLPQIDIPLGNAYRLGDIKQSLKSVDRPGKLVLSVSVNDFTNSWDIFVYPASLPALDNEIFVTQQFDAKAQDILKKGGKVLLTIKKGTVKPELGGNVQIGFSSIFWNTAWTGGQAPHTLGILCDPKHPALAAFPTDYHSNWQWWDAMSHSDAILSSALASELRPIVRVIDDWVTARSLGLIFECKVGGGKLIVSGIDLLSDQKNRPEARQLLYSLKSYMGGEKFTPATEVSLASVKGLLK
jgi:hypothetical protein